MVTGVEGQLGHDVVQKLRELNFDVVAPGRAAFDLTAGDQVRNYILKEKPDVIIHCAAYTAVDKAVDKAEEDRNLCYSVNVEGTKHIAESANEVNAKVVYISTDYVFDGLGEEPHKEDKETLPINYYGQTKDQGEQIIRNSVSKHFIVRTSWVYGPNGNNFVKTMLKLAETRDEINVVSDQIGAPTYTKDLAEFIISLIQTNKYGTYHGVNEGYCSWYEFAKFIFKESGIEIKVIPISSEGYRTKAKRPLNSRLSTGNTDRIGIKLLPSWEDALSRCIKEL